MGRPLPLTGASHTAKESFLGGPVDPIQVGTLGRWGSDVRSLFCLSFISHPCLGTDPRAGVQPSTSLTAIPPLSQPGSPILSQALPPPSINLCSRCCLYVPFSLSPRKKWRFREGNDLTKGIQLEDIKFRSVAGLGDSKVCAPEACLASNS